MAIEPQQFEEIEDHGPAPAVADPLSFIRPREKRKSSARRSRVVSTLRFVLPFGALAVLVVLVVWPMLHTGDISAIAMKGIPDLVIKNLHFTGLDNKKEPYSMTAAKATRPGGFNNIYDLDNPQAEITLANGAWVSGKAQYGRYNQDTRQLWLGGDVQLFHDKGYEFTTDEAQVDVDNNNAWGSGPVLIQGGFGEIRGSKGFRVLDSGNVMVVNGPAHASLDLHSSNASDKPTPAVSK